MSVFAKVILAVTLSLPTVLTESFNDVELLYKNLTTNRNKYMRPQKFYEDTTNVTIAFTLLHLESIDAAIGTVSAAGYFTVIWKDENLVWQPSDYNNTQLITLPHDQIWKPPLINSNSVKEMELFGQDGAYVELHYNGTAVWQPGQKLHFICDIDTTYFPFDKQICKLSVVSFGFPHGKIDLRPLSNIVNTDIYSTNNEWDLTETSVSVDNSHKPEVQYNLFFKRRPQFLVLTLILPGLFIALLNIFVFCLPHESGERIGYSITLLLAVVVFLTIAQDILPSTAVPRLSSFCIILMMDFIMSGMIVLSNIFSARIYYKSEDEPIPNYVQNVVQFGIFHCCLLKPNQVYDHESATKVNESITEGNIKKVCREDFYGKITWKQVSSYWDKVCFVMNILAFICAVLFFFIDVLTRM